MDSILYDLRYAARSLRRSPGFLAIAVLCLALGVGVNTAMFSMVNGILLRPLPFEDAGRVVSLQSTNERRAITEGGLTYADLDDFGGAGVFAELGGLSTRSFTLTGGEEAERVQGASVTTNLFGLLGVAPQVGRRFTAEEAAPFGFERVVLLSDGLWRRRFGADPGIVGRPVHINDRELTVIGVMPAQFRFPETEELWVPLGSADAEDRVARWIWGIGRLRPDVTLSVARERLAVTAARLAEAHPDSHRGWGVNLLSYRDAIVDAPAKRLVLLLLGAVGFVLLIACANVANLMLARAADRDLEIAVRAALGASRGRVVRQLLTESMLVAGAGALLGLLLAVWTVDVIPRMIPEDLAYWIDVGVDRGVLAYAAALAIVTALLFGTVPALQASRTNLHGNLKQGGRGGADTRSRSRFRSVLVAGEIALSMVLLVGAALLVQSFLRLQSADPGFATDQMLSMRIALAGDRYDPVAAKAMFHQQAADRLSALNGVRGAVVTSAIPADDGGVAVSVVAEGDVRSEAEAVMATLYSSTTGLFETLDAPLVAGRGFTRAEAVDTSASVVMVGRSLAERLWPGQDAIGRRLRIADDEWLTVIGIAPDVQYQEFGETTLQDRMQLHFPAGPLNRRFMAVLLRAEGDPASITRAARAELRALDPLLAPFDILTMRERRRVTIWPQRLFGTLFGVFGGIALALALSGVYGVMAYTVARRRREIGVRMALGARPLDVMSLVLSRGARLAFIGIVIGVAAALPLVRLLGGIIWGVEATDIPTFVTAPIALTAAALLASWLPARRAARVDPMAALRSE
jgi:predicted permease